MYPHINVIFNNVVRDRVIITIGKEIDAIVLIEARAGITRRVTRELIPITTREQIYPIIRVITGSVTRDDVVVAIIRQVYAMLLGNNRSQIAYRGHYLNKSTLFHFLDKIPGVMLDSR